MADPSSKYLTISPPEDQTDHSLAEASDVPEIGEETSELNPATAQTKWTYFLLGCAILLPWNALINATPFFSSRLVGSPFYPTFNSYLSSVYTLTTLVCQFYSTITSKQSSPSRRIYASLIASILFVSSLCLSTFIRGTPSTFLLFALFNTAALSVATGYLCTAVYAGAAVLGRSFLQTVLSGQAAIAVAVSAVQLACAIVSLWGSPPESALVGLKKASDGGNQAEEMTARIFFGVSAIFLVITLVAYAWLTRQPFYKSVTRILEQHREVGDADELTELVTEDERDTPTESHSRVYQVLRQNMIFMFSIAYVFTVTLSVYPAITARVQSIYPSIHPLLFTAVHFVAFNIGDLVGRYSCTFPCLIIWSAKKILAMSLLRTLFIPLILLCNVDRTATTIFISPVIGSDVLFMIIMLIMGYTNGYVSCLATLAASSLEHNPRLKGRREDVDIAATLGGSFVMVGLAAGALCSFGVQAMV